MPEPGPGQGSHLYQSSRKRTPEPVDLKKIESSSWSVLILHWPPCDNIRENPSENKVVCAFKSREETEVNPRLHYSLFLDLQPQLKATVPPVSTGMSLHVSAVC